MRRCVDLVESPAVWAAPPPAPPPTAARRARGRSAHEAGLAAEDAVARIYAEAGAAVLARRRRRREGEIDLIVRDAEGIAFVEVKRRKRTAFDDPVGEKQWRRLEMAAERYMIEAETGGTPVRFDLALVGPGGDVTVFENARI